MTNLSDCSDENLQLKCPQFIRDILRFLELAVGQRCESGCNRDTDDLYRVRNDKKKKRPYLEFIISLKNITYFSQ